MKRKYVKLFMASCLAVFFLSGCTDGQTKASGLITEASAAQGSLDISAEDGTIGTESREPTESQTVRNEKDSQLPRYEYTGDDPFVDAICKYFISENADIMDGSVYIPVPVILKTEEQEEEVLVYGTFWDFWYEQQGDNLFCTRGGANTGRLQMRWDGSDLTVIEFEKVRDGGDFTVDLKRICGEDTELYDTFFTKETREDIREARRRELVTQYINNNKIRINSYQDYGWEPVKLMTRFNTAFTNLGIRISLPENRNWIDNYQYSMMDESTAQVSYRDKLIDTDMILRVGSGDAQTLVGMPLSFSEEGQETWGVRNIESQKYIEIVLRRAISSENESYIIAEWDFNRLHYALWGKVNEESAETFDASTVAKTAAYIAEYTTLVQAENPW